MMIKYLLCLLLAVAVQGHSINKRATVAERRPFKSDDAERIRERALNANAPELLRLHTNEFAKQRIEIVDGIHFIIGYSLSNTIVIEAPDGLIIVDTLDCNTAAKGVLEIIRSQISTAPIKALIYTHNHPDHVGGARAFKENATGPVQVWAHENLFPEFWEKWQYNRPLLVSRGLRQVGALLPNGAHLNSGIGYRFILDNAAGLLQVPPTHVLTTDRLDVSIAGLDMTLLYIPGETRDQMGIYIPSQKVFIVADDFYKSFPNLYAIRGTPPRPVDLWFKSIDLVRQFDIEYLLPCHSLPVVGSELIQSKLTVYRDAIQYVHDQTLKMMNKGLHPEQMADRLKLPPTLAGASDLVEYYGMVTWSVKTVFESQVGWFSGFPEDLYPLAPEKETQQWLDFLPPEKIVNFARKKLDEGGMENIQFAVKLTSILWYQRETFSDTLYNLFMPVRLEALIALAELQPSANGRNYLLNWVLEETGDLPNQSPVFSDFLTIDLLPLENLMYKITVLLDASLVAYEPTTVYQLDITDAGACYTFTLRNSILELQLECAAQFDVKISIVNSQLRRVLKKLPLSQTNPLASVQPSMAAGEKFFSFLEDPTQLNF